MLKDLTSLSISSFSNDTDESLELVLYDWISGIALVIYKCGTLRSKEIIKKISVLFEISY